MDCVKIFIRHEIHQDRELSKKIYACINKMIKKADTIKLNEREYPTGSLDFLYANFDMANGTI